MSYSLMYVIVSRNQCNFCDRAKAVLRSQGKPYTEYNVQSASSKWLLSLMLKADLTTVPQIFSPDGRHIGGYTELEQELDQNTQGLTKNEVGYEQPNTNKSL
jgi:glutaredoxin